LHTAHEKKKKRTERATTPGTTRRKNKAARARKIHFNASCLSICSAVLLLNAVVYENQKK
jgi:hypothetical protein